MKSGRLVSALPLYWLAFFFALGIRFFQLGVAPLTETEASWALQALGIAHGNIPILGPQPAYILITSQLFAIFGNTNFMARLFPALAGSLVIWLPFVLRRWMGDSTWLQRAGVVMAFGLALDPGLVAVSRQAGSLMPAISFTLFFLAFFSERRMVWAGILAGLSLLSGVAFLQGALIVAISWGLSFLVRRESNQPGQEAHGQPAPPQSPAAHAYIGALISLALTLLVAGTLFLRVPQGISALADTFPAYIKSWVTFSGIPLLRLPISLLIYQPLALIFGIAAIVRAGFGLGADPRLRRGLLGIGIWAGVALLISCLYPAHQVSDIAWALIPLWALASVEISRSLLPGEQRLTRLVAAVFGAFLFVLAVAVWFSVLAVGRFQVSETTYWAASIGLLILGVIATLLVMAGWSAKSARLGIVWSLLAVFGLFMVSTTSSLVVIRQNEASELWTIPPATGQSDLLLLTLSDLSSWNTGINNQLEIVSLVDVPSLRWALRSFPNARFESALSPTASPPVVITWKGNQEPALTQQYRGQDFVWHLYPGWQGILPSDFLNWFTFRQAPLTQDQLILWARADIFPGGAAGNATNPAP